jgi:hypothetical protein
VTRPRPRGVLCAAPSALPAAGQQDLALLAGAAGVSVPAFVDVYWEWRRAYDLAELDVTRYWRQVGRGLGRSYGTAEISELARLDCASWLRLQAGTVALIEDLAAAGLPLALLSNAPEPLAEAIAGLPIAAFRSSNFQLSAEARQAGSAALRPCPGQAHGQRRGGHLHRRPQRERGRRGGLGLQSVHFTGAEGTRAAVTERLAVCG